MLTAKTKVSETPAGDASEHKGMTCLEFDNLALDEYRRRYAERLHSLKALTLREGQIANARLFTFLGGVAIAWFSLGSNKVHPAWLLAPVVAFAILVVVHDRVIRAIRRTKIGMEYYERGIARIEDRWAGAGWDGRDFAPKDHPYAEDLDLFGPGSLFQLLCTAHTRSGAKTLADWLCAPAPPDEIRARQEAVEELRPRIDLREELAHHGHGMQTKVFPEAIAFWASASPELSAGKKAALAYALSVATLLSIAVLALGASALPFTICVIALLILHASTRRSMQKVLASAEEPSRELAVVRGVLARLELERFSDACLLRLQQDLREGQRPASAVIARLQRLLTMREASLNMLFGPISFVLMWDFHLARAIDGWRCAYGPSVSRWIDAVGRLEALCSLASYAYEHPADPFPAIIDNGPLFEGKGLGHPLLSARGCVRNDVTLDGQRRLLIVSGSNMSGKTVLLRTVGVNVVLASAGAPVRAEALKLSSLEVGATLNVHDAIQDGVSRFYAEIKRIRALMDIANGPTPLLFLLDEVFHGTNSCDRRIGAQAVLRGLLDARSIGIVTTHDLAITELAEGFHGAASNVHFEDHLEENRLVFDYKLRPGVVTKSNALDLMRAIGLRVD